MRLINNHARVRVPATSGNLGPGFDSMGIAHDLWDEVAATLTTGTSRVVILGEGSQTLPRDENHLIIQTMKNTMEWLGVPGGGIELVCRNKIPQGRGLGSSAAAVVAALMLVKGLVDRPEALDEVTMLRLATRFEGHPDNAAPAIYGGATLSWNAGEELRTTKLGIRPDVHTSLLIPNEILATSEARSVLPSAVPHGDASFNASRTALLVHALEHRPELLFDATEDKLHQDYRADSMPRSAAMLKALRNAGWPAVISGAGPTILVFAKIDQNMARIVGEQGFHVVNSKQVHGAYLVDESE
ncbi:homoserine kinase [Arcanobacterium ihumii]|uniref:homoserine kinase n=1 Tax=Arcanobacterium ihumii TaxID=2138162 RepID=UPI000F532D89|nr:homoserine kinase [Arcanobacterium ihumii]